MQRRRMNEESELGRMEETERHAARVHIGEPSGLGRAERRVRIDLDEPLIRSTRSARGAAESSRDAPPRRMYMKDRFE